MAASFTTSTYQKPMSLSTIFDDLDTKKRGSLLFTSRVDKASLFTPGRKLQHVYTNDTEHINHRLIMYRENATPVNFTASKIVRELRSYFESRRERCEGNLQFKIWVVQNTSEPNPFKSKETWSTFCLWVFFKESSDPYKIQGLGDDGSHRWTVYGNCELLWERQRHKKPLKACHATVAEKSNRFTAQQIGKIRSLPMIRF